MARSALKNIMRMVDTAKQELPPEEDFLHDLKRSIELTNAKNSRPPSQKYKPSSMKCIRNMYYQVIGTEPDANDAGYTTIGIWNSGSDIHERIQSAVMSMKDNNIDCEYVDVASFVRDNNLDYLDIVARQGVETKLYHKVLNMSFLADGIIKYKGIYYILELKTETVNKWFRREGVDPAHYNQGTAYSIAFGLDKVIFVYISRDTLDMKSYMFEVTDEMKQELVGKIEECDSYVKKLIPPPKPEEAGNKFCQYCGYRTVCRRDG